MKRKLNAFANRKLRETKTSRADSSKRQNVRVKAVPILPRPAIALVESEHLAMKKEITGHLKEIINTGNIFTINLDHKKFNTEVMTEDDMKELENCVDFNRVS